MLIFYFLVFGSMKLLSSPSVFDLKISRSFLLALGAFNIVEMLFSSNLVAIVGAGEQVIWKLIIATIQ